MVTDAVPTATGATMVALVVGVPASDVRVEEALTTVATGARPPGAMVITGRSPGTRHSTSAVSAPMPITKSHTASTATARPPPRARTASRVASAARSSGLRATTPSTVCSTKRSSRERARRMSRRSSRPSRGLRRDNTTSRRSLFKTITGARPWACGSVRVPVAPSSSSSTVASVTKRPRA